MPSPATIDLPQIEILDVVSSAKGGKSASIFYKDGPVLWQPSDMTVAFEPGTYSGEPASRVDLTLRPQADAREILQGLDEFFVLYVAQHSEQFFGQKLSATEVQARYNPCLKQPSKEGYEPLLKLKMNISGKAPVRVWDGLGLPAEPPKAWKGLTVSVQIRLKGLYVMGKSFGCIMEAQDIRVQGGSEEPQCPF